MRNVSDVSDIELVVKKNNKTVPFKHYVKNVIFFKRRI